VPLSRVPDGAALGARTILRHGFVRGGGEHTSGVGTSKGAVKEWLYARVSLTRERPVSGRWTLQADRIELAPLLRRHDLAATTRRHGMHVSDGSHWATGLVPAP
jgi:hypothetical protein